MLKRQIAAFVKGAIRRQREIYLPNAETRQYRRWIAQRVLQRSNSYPETLKRGLLSVVTAVWDGSPVKYLQELARSLSTQNESGACEWILLDNGCSRPEILECLGQLNQKSWVKVPRSSQNLGIVGGLRMCLEQATGQYILPVDGDDLLYPDALRIITAHIQKAGYPAILYTDEDKVSRGRVSQPYFKPDWDPVLLANSAYIAHLGVIDRKEALRVGAYSNKLTEGSPDWDLFIRFLNAGHVACHIPEVVYSWRVHARSTADDAASKEYISSSQRAALEQFVDARGATDRFTIENNPFLPGAAHWRFVRRHTDFKPIACIILTAGITERRSAAPLTHDPAPRTMCVSVNSTPHSLADIVTDVAAGDGLICFLGENMRFEFEDWTWEALGLFELFPETVMVGGQIWDSTGTIVEAGQYFGFDGISGSPNAGRSRTDPGYFAQMWKQRSVSAVSTQCAVVRAAFLLQILPHIPEGTSLAFLGEWVGAQAQNNLARVVYTPFIGGQGQPDWKKFVRASERKLFAERNSDLIPDRRYYPSAFSLVHGYALSS